MSDIHEPGQTPEPDIQPKKNHRLALFILRLAQGIIIGAGAILPGISGGVLCVAFGIYRPMMELLSSPVKGIQKYYRIFLPVVIGWTIGFLVFAKVLDVFFSASSTLAICMMIGLIAGTTPTLIEESGREGRSKKAWAFFVVSILFLYALFSILDSSQTMHVKPSVGWYFGCGVFWGLSLVIPGMTSSSILIFLGLFQPLAEAVSSLDFSAILPMVAGIVLTAVLLSRFVNFLFRKYYTVIFHVIMGFVFASTLIIIPTSFKNTLEIVLSVIMFIAGYFIAWGTEKLSLKYQ